MKLNTILTGIACAGATTLLSFSVQAEHAQLPERIVAKQDMALIDLHSEALIADEQFVFNNALAARDWTNFFAGLNSELQAKQETILHFAGYASINPELLLALMEQQSQLVTNPTAEALQRPFADLSDEVGFEAQLRDVTNRLSHTFYAYKRFAQSSQQFNQDVASFALVDMFIMRQKPVGPRRPRKGKKITALMSAYEVVTGKPSIQLTQKQVSAPQRQALSAQPQAQVAFSMNLPWPRGYAWFSGGAHSNTGSGYPYSSLDFNNGSGGWGSNTPWVQAAHEGTVTRYSQCNIRITHPSGYATNYYHMDALQFYSGDYISAGSWIGRYANNQSTALCQGGQSTGPHVHFSLLYNGQYVSLQNRYISGYRIDVGNYNYDYNCYNFYFERNGYKTCAWQRLYR